MAYILLGAIGFVIGYLLELLPRERAPWARTVAGALSLGLLGFSLAMVSLQGSRFPPLPIWLWGLGGVLLPVAASLLAYSLFVELPLRSTYAGGAPRLVTSGSYALVRHPTVLWYGLLLLSLVLISRSYLLLLALPLWLGLDILWVVLQERFSLPRAFPDYGQYRGSTPMLVPNLGSIRACLASFRGDRPSGRYAHDNR
ncbi:MAG: hypothetical protein HYX99_00855 [Chloroflexi bacterium]|nr:hypothetical protein [Chloroflexota bacterium]